MLMSCLLSNRLGQLLEIILHNLYLFSFTNSMLWRQLSPKAVSVDPDFTPSFLQIAHGIISLSFSLSLCAAWKDLYSLLLDSEGHVAEVPSHLEILPSLGAQ